ncbi:hypothetical protein K501DRAFT_329926 [Backusella circina FSU 941]|nr:hypothetical protein K501DRAFT_329926 [Backusella circina FSU 941]
MFMSDVDYQLGGSLAIERKKYNIKECRTYIGVPIVTVLLVKTRSLYCSEKCLRDDALYHHPLLGYKYPEFKNFPHVKPLVTSSDHQTTDFIKKPADDQICRLATVSPGNHKQNHHRFNNL